MLGLLLAATLVVAFFNGANDNMKGVATLLGSGVLSYRNALTLATLSTLAGALASVVLAAPLVRAFSAKGLVPDAALTPAFLAAVGTGAGLTVLAATWIGMPVSTTHSLVGGLAGAGWVAAGRDLNVAALGFAFLLPLVVGPLLAVPLAGAGYRLGRWGRTSLGIEAETCVCIGEDWVPVGSPPAVAAARRMSVGMSATEKCQRRYSGRFAGVSAQSAVATGHVLSASLVGFARGLNDTPKILGLLVGASLMTPVSGALIISIAMAAGGLAASRRVARTLSYRVTDINPGQGFAGNIATSLLVVGASRFGLPVSTTHVSTGGIFGIGAASGSLRWRTVSAIVGAWIITLPMAGGLAAGAMLLLA